MSARCGNFVKGPRGVDSCIPICFLNTIAVPQRIFRVLAPSKSLDSHQAHATAMLLLIILTLTFILGWHLLSCAQTRHEAFECAASTCELKSEMNVVGRFSAGVRQTLCPAFRVAFGKLPDDRPMGPAVDVHDFPWTFRRAAQKCVPSGSAFAESPLLAVNAGTRTTAVYVDNYPRPIESRGRYRVLLPWKGRVCVSNPTINPAC